MAAPLPTGYGFRFDGSRYICAARPGDRLLPGPDNRVWIMNPDHPPRLIELQSNGTWMVRDMDMGEG